MDKKKIIIIAGLILIVGVGGYFGYKAYKKNKDKKDSSSEGNSSSGGGSSTSTQSPEVKAMINTIKADANWYANVKAKAANNKVSLEKQLIDDAKYQLANPNG
jgi:predicted negative regulator of RcsB-dependent stress response